MHRIREKTLLIYINIYISKLLVFPNMSVPCEGELLKPKL